MLKQAEWMQGMIPPMLIISYRYYMNTSHNKRIKTCYCNIPDILLIILSIRKEFRSFE